MRLGGGSGAGLIPCARVRAAPQGAREVGGSLQARRLPHLDATALLGALNRPATRVRVSLAWRYLFEASNCLCGRLRIMPTLGQQTGAVHTRVQLETMCVRLVSRRQCFTLLGHACVQKYGHHGPLPARIRAASETEWTRCLSVARTRTRTHPPLSSAAQWQPSRSRGRAAAHTGHA